MAQRSNREDFEHHLALAQQRNVEPTSLATSIGRIRAMTSH
jgi:hypothetical protein